MLRAGLIALALAMIAPDANAGIDRVGGAETLVASTAAELSTQAVDDYGDILLETIDVDAVAKFTLGRYARQLDSADVVAYRDAFRRYLVRQVNRNADQIAGTGLKVVRTDYRNSRDAVVTTRISRDGESMTLRWRVIERGGQWSVVDLEFAGVWLSIEQRAQVAALLDRPGASIHDVIDRLG